MQLHLNNNCFVIAIEAEATEQMEMNREEKKRKTDLCAKWKNEWKKHKRVGSKAIRNRVATQQIIACIIYPAKIKDDEENYGNLKFS